MISTHDIVASVGLQSLDPAVRALLERGVIGFLVTLTYGAEKHPWVQDRQLPVSLSTLLVHLAHLDVAPVDMPAMAHRWCTRRARTVVNIGFPDNRKVPRSFPKTRSHGLSLRILNRRDDIGILVVQISRIDRTTA